jgi:AMP-polyphosphate phosphotransferase
LPRPDSRDFVARMARITSAEKISKKTYETRTAQLRERIVQLQVRLKESPQPFKILLVVAGVAGSGRSEVLNTLGSWLDPRGVETFTFREPTDEDVARPFMWRFWRALPTLGRIGVYAGCWYTEALREEAAGPKRGHALEPELERIRHFERLLADNDTLIVKIWLHLDKETQKKRFKAWREDERTAWRVTEEDMRHHRIYDRLADTADYILRATHRLHAPWQVVDGGDPRARDLAVGEYLLARFGAHERKLARLARVRSPARPDSQPTPVRPAGRARLLALPLDQQLSDKVYEEKRDKWLGRLHEALRAARAADRAVVFAFEGWDAAGKGGAIRRLTSAIDVREYRVIPVAKPTDDEKAHHYLWRFWRQVPRDSSIAIFDRSWYGRVLVERLEGFCRPDEWRRAYREINDFEGQLVEHGTIVVKFWLQISRDEQLRRFRAREATSYKNHKINAEDWRNRRKWSAYEVAVGDMLAFCDTSHAPWHLIPANDKRHARLQVLKIACRSITEALQG